MLKDTLRVKLGFFIRGGGLLPSDVLGRSLRDVIKEGLLRAVVVAIVEDVVKVRGPISNEQVGDVMRNSVVSEMMLEKSREESS